MDLKAGPQSGGSEARCQAAVLRYEELLEQSDPRLFAEGFSRSFASVVSSLASACSVLSSALLHHPRAVRPAGPSCQRSGGGHAGPGSHHPGLARTQFPGPERGEHAFWRSSGYSGSPSRRVWTASSQAGPAASWNTTPNPCRNRLWGHHVGDLPGLPRDALLSEDHSLRAPSARAAAAGLLESIASGRTRRAGGGGDRLMGCRPATSSGFCRISSRAGVRTWWRTTQAGISGLILPRRPAHPPGVSAPLTSSIWAGPGMSAVFQAYRDRRVCLVNSFRSKLLHKKAIFPCLPSRLSASLLHFPTEGRQALFPGRVGFRIVFPPVGRRAGRTSGFRPSPPPGSGPQTQ